MIMGIFSDIWQYIPPTSCSILGVSIPNVVLFSSGPCVPCVPVKATVLWVVWFGAGYARAAWRLDLHLQA